MLSKREWEERKKKGQELAITTQAMHASEYML